MANKIKLKLTVKVTCEYTPNPKHYPEGSTPQDMLEIDIEGADEDPFMFLGGDGLVWEVSGEVL
jgi:hypothetical protein